MEQDENLARAKEPLTVGRELREAREAAGLSRSGIASQTKIAERHLIAIEEDRLGDLAAPTYAVGFARAYARALGLDEQRIAARARRQLDAAAPERRAAAPSFEPGDPARVPPKRLAWIAGGGAVLVLALLLIFWSSYLSPAGTLPDLLGPETPAPVGQAPATAAPAPAAVDLSDAVVLTATEDHVWVQVIDATGKVLLQKELANNESWTVPSDALGPTLRTGRPDALRVKVGGTTIPQLADRPMTMSDVSLSPGALMARANPLPTPGAGATQPGRTVPGPSAAPSPAPVRSRPASQGPASGAAPPATSGSREPAAAPSVPAGSPSAAAPTPSATPLSTHSG